MIKAILSRLFKVIKDSFGSRHDASAEEFSLESYKNIFDNAAEGIFQSAPDGHYLNVNSSFARIFGFSSPDEMKKSITDIAKQLYVDPNGRNRVKELLENKGFISNFEIECLTKSGGKIFVSLNAHAVRDAKGKIVLYEGTVDDITERNRAYRELRDSEEKYRALINNLNLGVYRNTAGQHGIFLETNIAIVKMFKYDSIEEFIKVNVSDLYANPQQRKEVSDEIVSKGFVRNKDILLRRKDGTIFWGSVNAQAKYDEHGNALWFDGIIEDITERKRIEGALKQSEAKYKGLYDSLTDGVVMVNMQGNIVECNQAYLDMLGYSQEEILKLKYQDITPEKWHKLEDEIVWDKVAKKEGYSGRYEKEYIKKGGVIFPVSLMTWLAKDDKGEINGMWSIVRDVSQQKKLEGDLRKKIDILERFQGITIDRELKMKELKEKISYLESELKKLGS